MNKLMNTEEAAAFLGKSPWWLRENIGTYGIPAYKIGRQWRYKREDLEEWLNLHKAS